VICRHCCYCCFPMRNVKAPSFDNSIKKLWSSSEVILEHFELFHDLSEIQVEGEVVRFAHQGKMGADYGHDSSSQPVDCRLVVDPTVDVVLNRPQIDRQANGQLLGCKVPYFDQVLVGQDTRVEKLLAAIF